MIARLTVIPITDKRLLADPRAAEVKVARSPERSHSRRHQATRDAAPALLVTDCAPDGFVEAVEHQTCRQMVDVRKHSVDDAGDVIVQQR